MARLGTSRRIAPPALAAVLALAYLLWQPPSLDLAAAEYRSWLFDHAGFAIWDVRWYGGHHLPGYSMLAPPLGAWLGPRLLGALAAVTAALLFEQLAFTRCGQRAWVGALWFAAGTATSLLSGRITFALGIVPALGALLAVEGLPPRAARADGGCRAASGKDAVGDAWQRHVSRRGRRLAWIRRRQALALGLALLTPLASPVAAIFLALAGTAHALGTRSRTGFALAAAALAPVAALAVAFPEGGSEPFAASAFWPVLAFAALALALLPRSERALRIGVALYALGAAAAFVLATPVGGNVVRLGALCAGPVAALVLWRRRMLALALVAPFLLWWQWSAAVDDVRTASGDPSVHAAFYAPLVAYLERAGAPTAGRVEIPFTRLHWEARWVAPHAALARGWERQLDRKVNAIFYDGTLTPAGYRLWLRINSVRWVALPDTRLDYSAIPEARLIERGLPYLHEVWHNRDWRVYGVRDPVPFAEPPARLTALGTDTLTLDVPRVGGYGTLIRVQWTPYWEVAQGDACVEREGRWTTVQARQPGTIRLVTRFSLARIGARGPRCARTGT